MKTKKYFALVLTVIVTVSMLTFPVYAAGIIDGLNNLQTQALQGFAIICTIAAVGVGLWTYVKTQSKPKTIGIVLFFGVLAGLAGAPEILTGWGTDIAGWFK